MTFTLVDKQFFLKSGLLPQIRTISGPLSSKKSGIGPKSRKPDLSGGTAIALQARATGDKLRTGIESDCPVKTKHCDCQRLMLTQCDFCPVLRMSK